MFLLLFQRMLTIEWQSIAFWVIFYMKWQGRLYSFQQTFLPAPALARRPGTEPLCAGEGKRAPRAPAPSSLPLSLFPAILPSSLCLSPGKTHAEITETRIQLPPYVLWSKQSYQELGSQPQLRTEPSLCNCSLKKKILNSCVDLIAHTLVHFSEISCILSCREGKQIPQAYFDLYFSFRERFMINYVPFAHLMPHVTLVGFIRAPRAFCPQHLDMLFWNIIQCVVAVWEGKWVNGGRDWYLNGGRRLGMQRSRLYFTSRAPATLCFVAYMVPQPAEEDKDFLLLPATECIALVCAERGKSARCLSSCWILQSCLQITQGQWWHHCTAGERELSSAALCNAGCSPSPAQDQAVNASQDPAQREGIHSVQEK